MKKTPVLIAVMTAAIAAVLVGALALGWSWYQRSAQIAPLAITQPGGDKLAQNGAPASPAEAQSRADTAADAAADAAAIAADVAAEAVAATPDGESSDAADQAQIAAEAAIAAADRAARAAAEVDQAPDAAVQDAGQAALDAARATRAAGHAAAQAIAEEGAPAAPAFVDVEKMRDVVESSPSMPAEVKAEILQLLDAAALDPAKLDEALVRYRAALQ